MPALGWWGTCRVTAGRLYARFRVGWGLQGGCMPALGWWGTCRVTAGRLYARFRVVGYMQSDCRAAVCPL